ncbi:MAG: type II toxin-antitoxin system RelE/ParE family toxin [Thalassotalea sp.]
MKFLIENNAQVDIKIAINWLAKKIPADSAKTKIFEIINDVKNQLIVHPDSGTKCQFDFSDKYREIIKNDYRTIYKIDSVKGEITIILFCHTRMNFQALLSQSNIYSKSNL